jgi:hypothetical protein
MAEKDRVRMELDRLLNLYNSEWKTVEGRSLKMKKSLEMKKSPEERKQNNTKVSGDKDYN